MRSLTPRGQELVNEVALRHGLSVDAVSTMLAALVRGQGSMAQFDHPELGGSGQWMQGGMTMVGDMFNNALKAKVDSLCMELSTLLLSGEALFVPIPSAQSQRQGGSAGAVHWEAGWWPAELGLPASQGSQNDIRYAIFPDAHRLVIDRGGRITVYDTLDHHIGGVSQQQGGGDSVSFTSQLGSVRLSELPVLSGGEAEAVTTGKSMPTALPSADAVQTDLFMQIEKLAALHEKGILSDREFTEKKKELLSRI